MPAALYRSEVYPQQEDAIGETVSPAPDGHPWRKACGVCLFRRSDPQDAGPHYPDTILDQTPGSLYTTFFCVHRTDENANHRVCACYAAHLAQRGVPPDFERAVAPVGPRSEDRPSPEMSSV